MLNLFWDILGDATVAKKQRGDFAKKLLDKIKHFNIMIIGLSNEYETITTHLIPNFTFLQLL